MFMTVEPLVQLQFNNKLQPADGRRLYIKNLHITVNTSFLVCLIALPCIAFGTYRTYEISFAMRFCIFTSGIVTKCVSYLLLFLNAQRDPWTYSRELKSSTECIEVEFRRQLCRPVFFLCQAHTGRP